MGGASVRYHCNQFVVVLSDRKVDHRPTIAIFPCKLHSNLSFKGLKSQLGKGDPTSEVCCHTSWRGFCLPPTYPISCDQGNGWPIAGILHQQNGLRIVFFDDVI